MKFDMELLKLWGFLSLIGYVGASCSTLEIQTITLNPDNCEIWLNWTIESTTGGSQPMPCMSANTTNSIQIRVSTCGEGDTYLLLHKIFTDTTVNEGSVFLPKECRQPDTYCSIEVGTYDGNRLIVTGSCLVFKVQSLSVQRGNVKRNEDEIIPIRTKCRDGIASYTLNDRDISDAQLETYVDFTANHFRVPNVSEDVFLSEWCGALAHGRSYNDLLMCKCSGEPNKQRELLSLVYLGVHDEEDVIKPQIGCSSCHSVNESNSPEFNEQQNKMYIDVIIGESIVIFLFKAIVVAIVVVLGVLMCCGKVKLQWV